MWVIYIGPGSEGSDCVVLAPGLARLPGRHALPRSTGYLASHLRRHQGCVWFLANLRRRVMNQNRGRRLDGASQSPTAPTARKDASCPRLQTTFI